MGDGDTSDCHAGSHVAVREVYGVFDISVFEEISDFFDCHNCTVFFGFLCGCTKMRCYEDSRSACYGCICKVCYVFLNLAAVKSFYKGILVNEKVSCEVQKNDTVFHLCESFFVDHLACVVCKRYMDSDVVALAVDLIQGFAVFDGSGKVPCCIDGDERVISVNFHSQMCCRVCNHGSDRTKTDDTKLLTADLTSCKLFFLFLSQFVDVFFVFFVCYPLNTTNDITGSKEHSCKDKLLNTICVCTWCVEYYDTFFCAYINRDVVDTCTCTSDDFDIFRKFHVMHLGTSYQDCIGIVHFFCLFVIISKQAETCL